MLPAQRRIRAKCQPWRLHRRSGFCSVQFPVCLHVLVQVRCGVGRVWIQLSCGTRSFSRRFTESVARLGWIRSGTPSSSGTNTPASRWQSHGHAGFVSSSPRTASTNGGMGRSRESAMARNSSSSRALTRPFATTVLPQARRVFRWTASGAARQACQRRVHFGQVPFAARQKLNVRHHRACGRRRRS